MSFIAARAFAKDRTRIQPPMTFVDVPPTLLDKIFSEHADAASRENMAATSKTLLGVSNDAGINWRKENDKLMRDCTWRALMATIAHSRWITPTVVPPKVARRYLPREIQQTAADTMVASIAGRTPEERKTMLFDLLEALVSRGRLVKRVSHPPDNAFYKDFTVTNYIDTNPSTVAPDKFYDTIRVKTMTERASNATDLSISAQGVVFKFADGTLTIRGGSHPHARLLDRFLRANRDDNGETWLPVTGRWFVLLVVIILRVAKVHVLDALT